MGYLKNTGIQAKMDSIFLPLSRKRERERGIVDSENTLFLKSQLT